MRKLHLLRFGPTFLVSIQSVAAQQFTTYERFDLTFIVSTPDAKAMSEACQDVCGRFPAHVFKDDHKVTACSPSTAKEAFKPIKLERTMAYLCTCDYYVEFKSFNYAWDYCGFDKLRERLNYKFMGLSVSGWNVMNYNTKYLGALSG